MTDSIHTVVERWRCPQCDYSAPPRSHKSERKHFTAHWLTCERCNYSTETKPSWEEATAAYRKPAATLLLELQAEIDRVLDLAFNEGKHHVKAWLEKEDWKTRAEAAESTLSRIQSETIEALKPFAALIEAIECTTNHPMGDRDKWSCPDDAGIVTIGDLRKLRNLYAVLSAIRSLDKAGSDTGAAG